MQKITTVDTTEESSTETTTFVGKNSLKLLVVVHLQAVARSQILRQQRLLLKQLQKLQLK